MSQSQKERDLRASQRRDDLDRSRDSASGHGKPYVQKKDQSRIENNIATLFKKVKANEDYNSNLDTNVREVKQKLRNLTQGHRLLKLHQKKSDAIVTR